MVKLKTILFLPVIALILFNSIQLYPQPLSGSTFFPLKIGNKWTYNISSSHTETVSDTVIFNNIVYYNITGSRFLRMNFWVREHDSTIFFFDSSSHKEYKLFDFKAKPGTSWSMPSGKSFEFECSLGDSIKLMCLNDTILTEAGVFDSCYHFRHITSCFDAGLRDTWFHKEIGIIRYTEDSFAGLRIYNLDKYFLTTSIDDKNSKPADFQLLQNYPNPFNPITSIIYYIPSHTFVKLKIFDMLGNDIVTLVDKHETAGRHLVQFNASTLPSGIYIYTIQADRFRASRKLLLLK